MRDIGIGKLFAIAVCAVTLGACAGTELDSARGLSAGGSSFEQSLFKEYIALSESEFQEGDYCDSDEFAMRGKMIAGGQMVGPENIGNRALPGDSVGALTDARGKLVAALESGAKDRNPMEAARAQAMFDCWMQEQEENRQPSHIARCRSGFTEALMALGSAPTAAKPMPMPEPTPPAPEPAKPEVWPKTFVVFFDHDSSEIGTTGKNRIDTAVNSVKKHGPSKVGVTGHADRSGQSDYNRALSKRRADAVVGVMVANGVSRSLIKAKATGEDNPRVKTPDGERNNLNRAVEIVLYK